MIKIDEAINLKSYMKFKVNYYAYDLHFKFYCCHLNIQMTQPNYHFRIMPIRTSKKFQTPPSKL